MKFGVLGGDRRQAELAELLRRDGAEVVSYGLDGETAEEGRLEETLKAEVIVLPLPLSQKEGYLNCAGPAVPLAPLFSRLGRNQRIFAGQVKVAEWQLAERYGLLLEDYFLCEALTVTNAAITAECALRLAMERRTLLGKKVLVLGYGRIGKILCHRLQGIGASVTAAARKAEDLAWIRAMGYGEMKFSSLAGKLCEFDLIYNTAPAQVLPPSLLKELKPDCLCIDLASLPGIDPAAAGELTYLWARGLPGKMAPRTAAEAIRRTIYELLS